MRIILQSVIFLKDNIYREFRYITYIHNYCVFMLLDLH